VGTFVRGDVVVVKYPFTTPDQGKRRPALVLACNQFHDLLLCPISSQERGGDFRIQIDSRDFSAGGLDLPVCEIRADIFFTMAEHLVERRAGQLSPGPVATVVEKIKAFIDGRHARKQTKNK